jgi:hypothetical protein
VDIVIKTNEEARYLVNRKGERYLLEIRRSPGGKTFIVIEKLRKHVYEKEGEEMIWEQDVEGAEEIEYEKLPQEVRTAFSSATRR